MMDCGLFMIFVLVFAQQLNHTNAVLLTENVAKHHQIKPVPGRHRHQLTPHMHMQMLSFINITIILLFSIILLLPSPCLSHSLVHRLQTSTTASTTSTTASTTSTTASTTSTTSTRTTMRGNGDNEKEERWLDRICTRRNGCNDLEHSKHKLFFDVIVFVFVL